MKRKKGQQFRYDVCLSFAGEDRAYVKEVASNLTVRGVRVFFDEYERSELWGKDLYSHLDEIYRTSAKYCVVFISKNYATKIWTNHERQSAQARALREHIEYILPVRFDKTKVPGMRDTVGYIDLNTTSAVELSELIVQKLGITKTAFLPLYPDRLFEMFQVQESREGKKNIDGWARAFLDILTKLSADERKVIVEIFDHACTCELPENVHLPFDSLRREVGFSRAKLKRLLESVRPFRLFCSFRRNDKTKYPHWGDLEVLVLEWHFGSGDDNLTRLAHVMITELVRGYCQKHRDQAIQRLDFSRLAKNGIDKECGEHLNT